MSLPANFEDDLAWLLLEFQDWAKTHGVTPIFNDFMFFVLSKATNREVRHRIERLQNETNDGGSNGGL